jgi:dTDP-4-dehydrorhamnose reductase
MAIKYQYCNPELWGGIECTINRIGNVFRDQLHYAGHYYRNDDIAHIAALGISKLRYPVLWERHQPEEYGPINWQWADKQLRSIRDHGITPIAGLVHHGSGPAFTDLINEQFPYQLAAYAAKVAQRFPWLDYYTPVNEPLTTARFSGLYGFWYPHHRDEHSFVTILLQQVKAVILSMEAIRKINPLAKLVQTEDLSKTHSTPLLSYQAEFENQRRWLTYDLLCGRFNTHHFFWNYFIQLGIPEKDLYFFSDHYCPPDIMGFNYYVTSERYLDEKLHRYPLHTHGGNKEHLYADTEAVRAQKGAGLSALLQEAWQRYHSTLAITECHIGCAEEEQVRWFKETWDSCCKLKNQGVDISAVTAWSLLGAYDWNSLLTKQNMHYEAGVFDVSDQYLRSTALAKMMKLLATGSEYDYPLVSQKGWWHPQTV